MADTMWSIMTEATEVFKKGEMTLEAFVAFEARLRAVTTDSEYSRMHEALSLFNPNPPEIDFT